MNRRVFAATLAVLLLTFPADHSLRASGPVYTVEDLGATSDGFVPTVTGMNASGQVSGYVSRPEGLRAVRFTDGLGWTYLPGLQSVYSVATAINATGDLTGYYMPTGLRAFRYVDGVGVTAIPVLSSGTYGIGYAIATNSDVVGYGNSAAGTRAWRASPGLPPVVAPALGSTAATACGINDAGQVVGSFTTAGYQHAFRLEPDGSLTDIGTLEGPSSSSTACAIDADGRVAGHSNIGAATHAFLFAGGVLTDIDTFGSSFSSAEAISNGVSVGAFTLATGDSHAFVHTDADGTSDLNGRIPAGSGWVLSDATAINSKGQIAGQGLLAGASRAFRLTPGAPLDTTAPVITSLSASPSSVTPPNKAMVAVTLSVTATDDQDPNPVCALSGIDGHGAPAADFSIDGPLKGSVRATGGATYSFKMTCTDAAGNAASRSVDVVVPPDTTPPVFTSLTATPSTIWPPKNQTVTVTTSATATDDSGETPVCTLGNITGPGTAPQDFNVTGANTGTVKAVGGRTYTFNETCVDGSGNAAWSSVAVTVPPDVTPPVISALTATPSVVTPPNHAMVPVTVSVTATDNVDDAPVCALAGITAAGAAASDFAMTGAFSASVRAVGGRTYSLRVTCSDAAGNSSSASVDVVVPPDTTPPVIASLTATPSRVWPPNDALVPVSVAVLASDDSAEAPSCALSAITSSGAAAGDYSITGQFSALIRAVGGRTYSLRVTCSDAAGNHSSASVDVVVPPDTTPPTISALSASPNLVWPPNGKMVTVTLFVSATDDVDATPTCALMSITGASAADAVIAGVFTANVRATKDTVYVLHVGCRDRAGNLAQGAVAVTVSKDDGQPVLMARSRGKS
jgi:probable HAF family extracellular repeat protein